MKNIDLYIGKERVKPVITHSPTFMSPTLKIPKDNQFVCRKSLRFSDSPQVNDIHVNVQDNSRETDHQYTLPPPNMFFEHFHVLKRLHFSI